MKLISCHVENFGRLHDFDYVFSDGINVICRENGWGKSTFAAFLLAMFYGLPAKGKKGKTGSGADFVSARNVRAACRPWQGGVFGGRLVFEADGRSYEMTRIFGDREAQDEFDLRDFETNLPSFDYTKNIGKELFLVDRESFLRTVFTSQQDCVTAATDDINALIADLAENAGDMESYEAAQKRLKDAANRLTPDRATGKLSRMAVQIGQLEQKTASSKDLEERIALCGREQDGLERKKASLEAEQLRLTEEIAAAERKEEEAVQRERADRDLLAGQQILEHLREMKERRRDELQKAAAYFPGRVPSRARTDALLKNCREMEGLEVRMQTEMLTEEEQEKLTFLEEHFADVSSSEKGVQSPKKGKGTQSTVPENAGNITANAAGAGRYVFLIPAGILLILAGAILAAAVPGGGSAVAAILLAAAGAGIAAAGVWRRTGVSLQKTIPDDEENAIEYARYLYLSEKEEKLEETHAAWSEARKPILRFLKELGFVPGEDLHAQLTAIRDAADDCEDAAALFRESAEELRVFEEGLDRSKKSAGRIQERPERAGQTGLKERRERMEQVREELLQCRTQSALLQNRMEDLLAEREERDAMLEEIRELREQQRTDEAGYRCIIKASALLQKARESLAARYADPIRRNFSRYWEMITGYSASVVYVDANSKVTVEERGKQRDALLLSKGWQDLAGICLRTALADAMYPPKRRERPPLILDDPFTNLDDEKMEGAMRFLRETGKEYQILYFTCSSARC